MRCELRRACERALQTLQALVPYQLGTVWTCAGGDLVPAASVGRPLDLMESMPLGAGSGLRAWVLHSGRVVRLPSKGRGFRDRALRGFLAVPLEYGGQRLGVLVLARTDGAFGEEDERRTCQLAGELARTLWEDGGE